MTRKGWTGQGRPSRGGGLLLLRLFLGNFDWGLVGHGAEGQAVLQGQLDSGRKVSTAENGKCVDGARMKRYTLLNARDL